jgi:hypothetical protein
VILSDHEVNSHLRDKLQNVRGRHLCAVLGTYEALAKYERTAFPELRGPGGKPLAPPINVNRTLLDRIPDAESKSLVANEARRPEFVRARLYQGFDQLLADELGRTPVVTLKHLELLFAYDLELNTLRTRAVNEKYILLLLPGQRAGDRITLFHEALPEWHKTLPRELLPEDHLFELKP